MGSIFNNSLVEFWGIISIGWLILSFILSFVLLKVFNFQRFSEFPRALRWPLFLTFLLLFILYLGEMVIIGYINTFPWKDIGNVVLVIIRLMIGYFLWRTVVSIIKVIYTEYMERNLRSYGRTRSKNTADLLYILIKPVSFLLIVSFVAYLFHFDVLSMLVALGAGGIAIAFALQSVLTNVLAGLSLALDTEFAENDIIRVGSSNNYQIIKRGLRVTKVRDINTHETVYLPNKLLTDEVLVDITRPTDDLRVVLNIGVAYKEDLRDVRKILIDIANGHPHVIGDYSLKEKAILEKVYRLYIRKAFDDCKLHFIELARLKAEEDLNTKILLLKTALEDWANYVDEVESKGFDKKERDELKKISETLYGTTDEIIKLTTIWLIMFRNCSGTKRKLKFPSEESGKFNNKSNSFEIDNGLVEQYTGKYTMEGNNVYEKLLKLHEALTESEENIKSLIKNIELTGYNFKFSGSEWRPPVNADNNNLSDSLPECFSEIQGFHNALEIANKFSEKADIVTKNKDNKEKYDNYEKACEEQNIKKYYTNLGIQYGKQLRSFAEYILKEENFEEAVLKILETEEEKNKEFRITQCRSRSEDLYKSNSSIKYILDHPLLKAIAGEVEDDDERSDLADLFRQWGDKCSQLKEKAKVIKNMLLKAKSTRIDTELRAFAEWLKKGFKDPFPAWKYPIAPIEEFGDSSINLSMKVYIDNVRMERYFRTANAYTQFRLRIKERFDNEGINIPFPQRDLHVFESKKLPVEILRIDGIDDSDGKKKDSNDEKK